MYTGVLAVASLISVSSAYLPMAARTIVVRDGQNQTNISVAETTVVSVVSIVDATFAQTSDAEPTVFSVQVEKSDDGTSTATSSEEAGRIGIFVAHMENSADSLEVPTESVAVGVIETPSPAPQTAAVVPPSSARTGVAANANGPLLVLPSDKNIAAPQPTPQKEFLAVATGIPITFPDGQPAQTTTLVNGQSKPVQIISEPGSPTAMVMSGVSTILTATPTPGVATAPPLTIAGQTFTALYSSTGPVYAIDGQVLRPGPTTTAIINGKTYTVNLASDSSSVQVIELDDGGKATATSTRALPSRPISTTAEPPSTRTESAAVGQTLEVGAASALSLPSTIAWGLGLLQGCLVLF